MSINQLSTSNTFQQWLIATQVLIEKSNYYEDRTNLVFDTANAVFATSNNVSNTANAFYIYTTVAYAQSNASFNVANQVYDIANAAYDTANLSFVASANAYDASNAALAFANSASATSNLAFGVANAGFAHANAAFNFANTANAYANAAFHYSNLAYTYANSTLAVVASANATISNGVIAIGNAYNSANLFISYVANNSNLALMTNDTTTDNNQRYVLFAANTGVLVETFISNGKLYYNPSTGTLNATNFNSLSDQSFKTNVIYIEDATATLKNVDGVGFTWVDNGKKSYGVVAQELEKILPDLVDGTDQKSVNYSGLIAFLINAVKELDNRVSELENIINKE
jgi:hypothetical protein